VFLRGKEMPKGEFFSPLTVSGKKMEGFCWADRQESDPILADDAII